MFKRKKSFRNRITLNRRMDNRAVERLFIALMAVIIGISVFNAVRYAGVL